MFARRLLMMSQAVSGDNNENPVLQIFRFLIFRPALEKAMIAGLKEWAAPLLMLLCGWACVSSASEPVCCPLTLNPMNWDDLDFIYRQAEPGRIPNGFAQGRVVYCPDAGLAKIKSRAAQLIWKGKDFCAEEGTLVNQWCGIRAIRATVSYGTSWLDGKPAIILDYSGTSRVWSDVRDEMREISPGVYVGAMYLRRCPEPRLKLFFVLRACD
jgi:hypothetical protein